MITAYWISQAVYVAAKLELADRLRDGPRSADDLARETGMHAPSLYRLLRALASVGVFAEETPRQFSLTPLAQCLRRDVMGSQWAMAVIAGEEHYGCYGELLYSVQTGKTAFEKIHGEPIFDFFTHETEKGALFDQAMVSVHGRETGAVLDAYDFSGIGTIADLGGGNGSVLTAVLRRYPAMKGILYDLPGVAERAKASLQAAGLADRCQVIGGSFFESVPAGADAYMMRHIIHDWDDVRCLQILRNIHRAMRDDGKLLIIEGILPPGNQPSFGKLLDLTMLVIPGGQERTREEYEALFQAGGFRVKRILPTSAEVSVVEGRKG